MEYNGARFDAASSAGHYESWFQRANHPTERRAFWIRYTIFSPRGRPNDAVGELWAIYFDGDSITAVKEVHPAANCRFASHGLNVQIAESKLDDDGLTGQAALGENTLGWTLRYQTDEAPLLLLPEKLYGASLPKAKALVGGPMALFEGNLHVNGDIVPIEGWMGSQNHNWGSKHTDEYAWGQVAGFDEAAEAFLELSTARIHLGPIKTPWLTPMVLRLDGREHRLSSILQAVRNDGSWDYRTLRWTFSGTRDGVSIDGTIHADRSCFVGLPYDNPPGGRKTCLNSKLATCDLMFREGSTERRLTSSRAAFEILTDAKDHGIPVLNC